MKNLVNALRIVRGPFLLIAILASCSITVFGQMTAFTYQGKLADSGTPATANYDFEFKLFNTATVGTGTQQGSTVQRLNVSVANGVFTVSLDFGVCAGCFTGADRFLEISVKPNSGGTLTTLAPRQPITSTPYALKSVNATAADGLSVTCVNCVTSSQIGSVNGSAVSGAIPAASVPAGSGNYIQNNPASQQASSSFNITGNGTLGGTLSGSIVNAATQYNIGGSRVLSIGGGGSTFAGISAGGSNPTGINNSFFGVNAGSLTSSGSENSFFGRNAGNANTIGSNNTIVGSLADVGANNLTFATAIGAGATVGNNNTVVLGRSADTVQVPGALTVTGVTTLAGTLGASIFNAATQYNIGGSRVLSVGVGSSTFAGIGAGASNPTGLNNSFFGVNAGSLTGTGGENSFFGRNAGNANTTGSNNTMIGSLTDVGSPNLTNTTAIGFRAFVGQSNSLVLGSINGVNGSNADTSVGIGTTAPAARFHVIGNSSAATTPVAIFQSAGSQVPLAFRSGGSEVARFRADSQGNLVLATLNGTDKDIYFRAGDDSAGADMFIQSSTGNVGIGTTAPTNRLTVGQSDTVGGPVVGVYGAGLADIIVRDTTDNVSGVFSANADRLVVGTVTNHEVQFRTNNITRMTISPAGFIGITDFGAAGSAFVCFNNSQELTICGSSIRYKSNVSDFRSGLDLIRRLRPVSFNWKDGGMLDMGLVAEEVAEVEPLLVTHNKKGVIEGVKYDRVGVVLINAVNEQQAQIESQQKQIEQQRIEIDALKVLVCSQNPGAEICRSKK